MDMAGLLFKKVNTMKANGVLATLMAKAGFNWVLERAMKVAGAIV